jgi:hypothetical protein
VTDALAAQSRRLAEVQEEWRHAVALAAAYLLDRSREGDAVAGEIHDMLDRALTSAAAENIAARTLLAEAGR